MLNDIGDLVQIIGFPLAIVTILLASRDGRNSRDLQAALACSESFLNAQDSNWRDVLNQVEHLSRKGRTPSGHLEEQFLNMLNWLDALGRIIDARMIARPRKVLASISPSVLRILKAATPLVLADDTTYGLEFWRGLRALGHALGLPDHDPFFPPAQPPSGGASHRPWAGRRGRGRPPVI